MRPPCPHCGRAYRWVISDRFTDELLQAAKLDVPQRKPHPDAFYEAVAAIANHPALIEFSSQTRIPVLGKLIADANNVPKTRAHGWVKEARRRGMLPPSTGRRLLDCE